MPHLYVIAGHGAGDSGACAFGYQEAERVRTLAKAIGQLGGADVTVHPVSDDAYQSKFLNECTMPSDWCVLELHMDASDSSTAKGGHVIVNAKFDCDDYDMRCASVLAKHFPGRANMVSKRIDLYNCNACARRGINYRLMECGFITNADDLDHFNKHLVEIAKDILEAFELPATGEADVSDEEPVESPRLEVDGYWGEKTVAAWQKALGTPADGIVSGQDYRDMRNIGGTPSTAWKCGSGGSQVVKAWQKVVGASADGYFGKLTLIASQQYLGTEMDGVLSRPSKMVMELQNRLNNGTLVK